MEPRSNDHVSSQDLERRMTPAILLGYSVAFYVAVGVCVALAFVTKGVDRVLDQKASFSVPVAAGRHGALALCPVALVEPTAALMTRTHRRFHHLIWPVLAIAVVFGA